MILKAKAPAKINLFLHVVGKRDDGYHLLESLFSPIDQLYDEITASKANMLSVNYSSSAIEKDIILKTAQLLKQTFKVTAGAHFEVEKNIPISAGLGGGSSNAATAIKLLNQLWELNLSKTQMIELAAKIGADVPFFINAKTSFVEGIGDKITPITLGKKVFTLLINPGIDCSTADIFNLGFEKFDTALDNTNDLNLADHANSLTKNAISIHPEIQNVLDFLNRQQNQTLTRMSGSGATCFALFKNKDDLLKAEESMPKEWWAHSQELIL